MLRILIMMISLVASSTGSGLAWILLVVSVLVHERVEHEDL